MACQDGGSEANSTAIGRSCSDLRGSQGAVVMAAPLLGAAELVREAGRLPARASAARRSGDGRGAARAGAGRRGVPSAGVRSNRRTPGRRLRGVLAQAYAEAAVRAVTVQRDGKKAMR